MPLPAAPESLIFFNAAAIPCVAEAEFVACVPVRPVIQPILTVVAERCTCAAEAEAAVAPTISRARIASLRPLTLKPRIIFGDPPRSRWTPKEAPGCLTERQ